MKRRVGTSSAPEWAMGLFAGVQGALLSYLMVVVPAMAAYVATATDPANDEIGWPRSVAIGGSLWLLGQGATLDAGEAAISLVPLGMTALIGLGAWVSARRSAPRSWASWAGGVSGHVAVVGVVLAAVRTSGPAVVTGDAVARTLAGAAVLAAVGIGLGTGRAAAWREASVWTDRVPVWFRRAIRAGLVVPAALVAAAAAVTLAWGIAGRAATGDILHALGIDPFGGAMLLIGELALVPNLVLWALAWLTGAGFTVGAGTLFAPTEVVGGPMPAVPLLGALPPHSGGVLVWAPLLVVAVGVFAGAWLGRTLAADQAWQPLAAMFVVPVVAAMVGAVLAVISSGSAGPERFAVVGPLPWDVAWRTAALVLPGAALVVPMSAVVRQSVGRTLRAAWQRTRG
jgi:hypothetical protein